MLYSVFISAFNITISHCDDCESDQTLIVTYEKKVILWWKWNEKIKKHFKNVHNLNKKKTLYSTMQDWLNLKWCIIKVKNVKMFLSNIIYAVLSLINSIISEQNFVDMKWLRDEILTEKMKWKIELIEKRLKNLN